MKTIQEGTWFAFPLVRGGFCVGLVAREARSILVAYFFNGVWEKIPTLDELRDLSAGDAARVLRVGALGFTKGSWVAVGHDPAWDRRQWPIPKFVRRERIQGKAWMVEYSDTNPNEVVSEVPTPPDTDLELDGLYGAQAAESVMNSILGRTRA